NQNMALGGAGNLVITGIIGTGAGIVTKDGTGTLVLNAANTFTGGFTLDSGTVIINNATALGAATGMLRINGGTIASTNNNPFTIGNLVTLNGDLTLGQAVGGTGALTFNNQVDLGSGVRTLTLNN